MGKEIKLDEYQQKVVDFVENGIGNAVVNACAGSGKTHTIKTALNVIPETEKVLFVAFNKSIVSKLNKEVTRKKNTYIMTYHSLGYKILLENLGNAPEINDLKYHTFVSKNIKELSDGQSELMAKDKRNQYIRNVVDLTFYARYNLMQSEREIKKLCGKYDILPLSNECSAAVKALKWGSEFTAQIDFTDMIWIPVEKRIFSRKYKFDFVFIDEAQDSSPVQQCLFKQCLKSNGRCVMVGDEHQCINAWCGADTKAFQNLMKIPNTTVFSMPISHRCSQKVVLNAQQIVPTIKADPNNPEGSSGFIVGLDEIKAGDMVISRTTEPLVRLQMKNLKSGKKSYIVGKKIGDDIIKQINELGETKLSPELIEKGVIPKLYYNLFSDIKRISAINHISEFDALTQPVVVKELDFIHIVEAISEGIDTPREAEDRIRNMFIPDNETEEGYDERLINSDEFIMMTTIHRGKGQEAKNVFLVCSSQLPSPFAKTKEELQTEKNIEYVGITRALENFYRVSEKDLKPSRTCNNKNDLSNELKEISDKIISLYGPIAYELTKKEMDNIESFEYKKENPEKQVTNTQKKKKIKFTKFI